MGSRHRFSLRRFRRLSREFGLVALLGATIGLGGLTVFESVSAAPPSDPSSTPQAANATRTALPRQATPARTQRAFEQSTPIVHAVTPRQSAFPNCDAARAAGAAPVYAGEPGYGAHLDGDDDGIGCEPHRRR